MIPVNHRLIKFVSLENTDEYTKEVIQDYISQININYTFALVNTIFFCILVSVYIVTIVLYRFNIICND